MKLATLAVIVTVVAPLAASADSSQPNSGPGLQGRPLTNQGESTTGMASDRNYPGQRGETPSAAGTTDAGKAGYAGTRGASDSSIPGATNPNEPIGSRR